MAKTSKATAAYLAGLIDGEGYIALRRHPYAEKQKIYYTPIVKVALTYEPAIAWLKDSFGGWYYRREPQKPNHKPSYYWTLTGKGLTPFLQTIKPYLKIKKTQCELVLEKIKLQEKKPPWDNISRQVGQRDQKAEANRQFQQKRKVRIEELYWELRKLNTRGVTLHAERLSETTSKEDSIV